MSFYRPTRSVVTPTDLRFSARPLPTRSLVGLSGANLGYYMLAAPQTYGDLREYVASIIERLEAAPAKSISFTNLSGTDITSTAGALVEHLQQFIGEEPADLVLPATITNAVGEEVPTSELLSMLDTIDQQAAPWYAKRYFWGSVVVTASVAASMVHGYKRNRRSWGWAFAWGALGFLFPVITPAVALAQGYGKPKR